MLLALLPDEVRALVEASFDPVAYSFGTVIEREDDPASAFYVLVSGTARVIKAGDNGEEVLLNSIRPGEAFGEIALLEDTHRSATVRASSPVEALRPDRTVFQALVRSNPELRHIVGLQARPPRLRDFFRVHSDIARLPADALAQPLRAGAATAHRCARKPRFPRHVSPGSTRIGRALAQDTSRAVRRGTRDRAAPASASQRGSSVISVGSPQAGMWHGTAANGGSWSEPSVACG